MSNDKAQATNRPTAPQGWDGSNPAEWAPKSASTAATAPSVTVNVAAPQRRTNHGLHLLLSIVTFGAWVPVWIVVAITNRSHS